jgi:hypothetical protein
MDRGGSVRKSRASVLSPAAEMEGKEDDDWTPLVSEGPSKVTARAGVGVIGPRGG